MRFAEIKAKTESACTAAGRGDVTLIAVSKLQPLQRVITVLEAGHRVFGENRVQEAAGKWPDLMTRFAGCDLHLLGPLQSNKARQAAALFSTIHTLDRPKLATILARLAQDNGASPDLFVQVNTGGEPQKGRHRACGGGQLRGRLPRHGFARGGPDVHPPGG